MFKPIKGNKIFSQVYQSGRRFYENDAFAIICFRENGTDSPNAIGKNVPNTFYAVAMGKKIEKAVVRNRIKRLLRESIKKAFKDFEDYYKVFEYIIIFWKNSPGQPGLIRLKDVEPVVRKLLLRAYNSVNKKRQII